MTDKRTEYIEKTKQSLDTINARIRALEEMANEKKGEASRELRAQLNGIQESKYRMEHRLEELKLASEPAWEDLKRGTEQAWSTLSDAVRKAAERLQ